MSKLADSLATLTSHRNRNVVDVTLVGVLLDLLHSRTVSIFRIVGETSDRRWFMRACLRQGDIAARSDPAWIDIESLPRLTTFPARYEAIMAGRMVATTDEAGHLGVFPLMTDGEVVGVLEIATDALLDSSAHKLIAAVLRIFSNFQSLLDYSERDSLTGLLNRKSFDESFSKLSSLLGSSRTAGVDGRRAAGMSNRCWLGMIDIDHFKSVNDNFGHLIGDEVLLLLSRVMRNSFRFHDTLYRFGGEEFVVLIRCDQEHDTTRILDRLRRNVESYAFPQVGSVTISVGFTELKARDPPSAALARADKAVYYAKRHGRNQVYSYAELVARGEIVDVVKVGEIELF